MPGWAQEGSAVNNYERYSPGAKHSPVVSTTHRVTTASPAFRLRPGRRPGGRY